jgi:hypothetical protein
MGSSCHFMCLPERSLGVGYGRLCRMLIGKSQSFVLFVERHRTFPLICPCGDDGNWHLIKLGYAPPDSIFDNVREKPRIFSMKREYYWTRRFVNAAYQQRVMLMIELSSPTFLTSLAQIQSLICPKIPDYRDWVRDGVKHRGKCQHGYDESAAEREK